MKGIPDSSLPTELSNYETHARIWEQVDALSRNTMQGATLYLGATGAFWVVVAPNTFHLSREAWIAAVVLHLTFSYAAVAILAGWANTIRQRLNFLNDMGSIYWPNIERLGRDAQAAVGGVSMRTVALVWPALLIVGVLGTLALYFLAAPPFGDKGTCIPLFDKLRRATAVGEVEYQKLAIAEAGCQVRLNEAS